MSCLAWILGGRTINIVKARLNDAITNMALVFLRAMFFVALENIPILTPWYQRVR
jgi:hypothetical protein